MRTLAIASIALAACGSPQPVGTQPAFVDDGYEPPARATTTTPDAGVDAIENDVVAKDPPVEYVVSYDKPAEAEEIEFVPPEDDGTSPGVTIENGVAVVKTRNRMWCVVKGRAPGLCYSTKAECQRRNTSCSRRSNYACALYTTRTDGRSHAICTDTYGVCLTAMVDVSNDSEVSETGECIVMRYDPKAKK